MVAYINIQMTEYLATNYSLFDLAIVTIVIVSILILGLVYFSGSKKKTECTASLSVEEEKSDSDLVLSPRITIVFQKDLSDDEEDQFKEWMLSNVDIQNKIKELDTE